MLKYKPGTYFSPIFELQPSKTRSFPIKTRVIWVPGKSRMKVLGAKLFQSVFRRFWVKFRDLLLSWRILRFLDSSRLWRWCCLLAKTRYGDVLVNQPRSNHLWSGFCWLDTCPNQNTDISLKETLHNPIESNIWSWFCWSCSGFENKIILNKNALTNETLNFWWISSRNLECPRFISEGSFKHTLKARTQLYPG